METNNRLKMGKAQSTFLNLYHKRVEKKDLFSEEEFFRMRKMLVKIAGDNTTSLTFEQMRDYLQSNMHCTMIERLFMAMQWDHKGDTKDESDRPIKFSSSVSTVAFFFVVGNLIKGNTFKKAVIIRFMMGKRNYLSVTGLDLVLFVKDLLSDHLTHVSCSEISSKFTEPPENLEFAIENLAVTLLQKIFNPDGSERFNSGNRVPLNAKFDDNQINEWLQNTPMVLYLLNQMMLTSFPIRISYIGGFQSFLPRFLQLESNPVAQSMLDTPSVIFLNHNIPNFSDEQHEWILLHYSDKPADRTFRQIVTVCLSYENTLIIVEDSNLYRFGGFSCEKWSIYPKYRGSKGCFVFSLIPFMAVYNSTGINKNWIYLNTITFDETLHCLAFGGTVDFYSFCINGDCETGMSYPSLTYNSPQLSSTPNFKLTKLEVWAIIRTVSPSTWRKKIQPASFHLSEINANNE